MPSAFISYSHEDQEFVLALVGQLKEHGLDIRYDQVILHVGDSLIRAISREIAEGDFLIAIVSPSSIESEWCQKELALAETQGINERRVKVLPVKFRGAPMPDMLGDSFYADADRFDLSAVARALAASMSANLEGREADADREAEEAEGAGEQRQRGEDPAAVVAQIDEVADKVWDLVVQWERCRQGAATADLQDRQRRLRWAFESLPQHVREALPLVKNLSEMDWDDYFRRIEPQVAEPDIREELRAARTQIAEGLPVRPRWVIDADYGEVSAGNRDAVAYLWQIRRGVDETRRIQVFISGTAMASANEHLPTEVAQAKETNGRSVVANLLSLDDLPSQVMVTTAGVSLTMPD